jgi:hypothetical protein
MSLLNISHKNQQDVSNDDTVTPTANNKDLDKFQSPDSTLTSSNSSINSIVKSPLGNHNHPSFVKNGISTIAQKLKGSETEAIKLIDDDCEEVTETRIDMEGSLSNSYVRYTPSSATKTKQQLQNELSNKKPFLRTKSQTDAAETQSSNEINFMPMKISSSIRSSIASSISSINKTPSSKLNFDLVNDEIRHMADSVKKNKNGGYPSNFTSNSNLNQSRTSINQHQSKSKSNLLSSCNSINNSISNIYIKAINEKREANKQKLAILNKNNQNSSSTDSSIMNFNSEKRHYIIGVDNNINNNNKNNNLVNFNPNPLGVNRN